MKINLHDDINQVKNGNLYFKCYQVKYNFIKHENKKI